MKALREFDTSGESVLSLVFKKLQVVRLLTRLKQQGNVFHPTIYALNSIKTRPEYVNYLTKWGLGLANSGCT